MTDIKTFYLGRKRGSIAHGKTYYLLFPRQTGIFHLQLAHSKYKELLHDLSGLQSAVTGAIFPLDRCDICPKVRTVVLPSSLAFYKVAAANHLSLLLNCAV
jgi:hypothetical protein